MAEAAGCRATATATAEVELAVAAARRSLRTPRSIGYGDVELAEGRVQLVRGSHVRSGQP